MDKLKMIEKPVKIARDARSTLTEHYREQATERNQREQSPNEYAAGQFEDSFKEGARTTVGAVSDDAGKLRERFKESRAERQYYPYTPHQPAKPEDMRDTPSDNSRSAPKERRNPKEAVRDRKNHQRKENRNANAQPEQAGHSFSHSESIPAAKERRALQTERLKRNLLKEKNRRVSDVSGTSYTEQAPGGVPERLPTTTLEQTKKDLQVKRAGERQQKQRDIRQAEIKGQSQRHAWSVPGRVDDKNNPHPKQVGRKLKKEGRKAGVKTASAAKKQAVKRARQEARKQVMKRAAQIAKATAKATVRTAKLMVKAAAAAVKGIIALLSALGPLVVIIIFLAAVAALIASPFGLFFSGQDTTSDVKPVAAVIQEITGEYDQRIEDIKDGSTYDTLDFQYTGTGGSRGNIWIDILAVFAVKTALADDGMDVATIDQARIDLIREVFWDMTDIDHWIEIVEHTSTSTDEDGNTTTDTWYEYILHITVTQRTAQEQAGTYGFNSDQLDMLDELLSGEYDSYFMSLIAGTGYLGDGTGVIAEGVYIWPSAASDYVTSFFGTRLHPILGVYKSHNGIDIGAGHGTVVLAAADGTVTTASYDAGGYGYYIIIDHGNGSKTLYAHMSQLLANAGQTVTQGDTIGLVGSTGMSTGPHLHFETYVNGTRVDPLLYFSNYSAAW